jgi:CheY-like chemotaxis protein/PAS domain-containing protein
MAEHTGKKKLLILEGPDARASAIEEALRGELAIERVAPENARAAIEADQVAAVLADKGAFLPLAREFADLQAQNLLGAIGEGLCVADTEGVVLWANGQFALFDDRTRDSVTRCCREAASFFVQMRARAAGPAPRSRKFHIASANDEKFYEVVVSPLDDGAPSAQPSRLVAVVWDVTATSRIQQKIDAIDRAGAELVRLEVEHVKKLNAAERVSILEDKVIKYAHDLLEFDHFTIHLLDEESGRLELVMSKGVPREIADIDLYASREGSGTTGYVAATGRSYICYDTAKDERYIEGLEQAGSSLAVPLLLSDKVIGVFNAESREIGAFSEDDRQFAEILARYIALSLHILDLLVVERYTTGETVSGVVEGELNEPLDDLTREAEWLRSLAERDPDAAAHAEQILRDVESIRSRMKSVSRGPRSILGADEALRAAEPDPVIVGKRILVADDEPQIRNTIRDVLMRRGATVFLCQSGAEAIELLEDAEAGKDEVPHFDLIVSDIRMPDRNGYEVFSAARRWRDDLPVILMTGFGYDPHHSIVRASQEGLQCVLFKPFQARQLLEEVRRAFEPAAK